MSSHEDGALERYGSASRYRDERFRRFEDAGSLVDGGPYLWKFFERFSEANLNPNHASAAGRMKIVMDRESKLRRPV